MKRIFLLATLALLLRLDGSNHALVQALPSGFANEGVTQITQATGFAFAPKPDGSHMMLVCGKRGYLWLLRDPENSPEKEQILDISDRICTTGERGVQTVAVHPNFVQNRYIYLFYPWPKFGNCGESSQTGPVSRVSRWQLDENYKVKMDSEFIIFETSSLGDDIHNCGDMAFGKDGYLYITTGDGGLREDRYSQMLDYLLGSLLRLNDDGTIPEDNPFTSKYGYKSTRCHKDGFVPKGSPPGTVCGEIFAYGLRNPFRMALDPNTANKEVRILVDDVGGGMWEETNVIVKGGNYGWPVREGPCFLNSETRCEPPNSKYQDPIHWYKHPVPGAAAVGITIVPRGLWPPEYDDAIIFADFVSGDFSILERDRFKECRTCIPPVPPYQRKVFHTVDWPVQLTFGPYKGSLALYYSSRGSGYQNIRRIYYKGGTNKAPVAAVTATPMLSSVGNQVEIDGSGSFDPDGDPLDFDWTFGDGSDGVSGGETVWHTFNSPGEFLVSLTVRDPTGFVDTAYIEITVGSPPVVKIDSPAEGTQFYVGEVFTLSGSAVDGHGNPMPDSSLSWEVRQHHNTHFHPFLDPTTGNNIVLHGAPAPEDFQASTNSHLEVILTATDSNGVHGSLSRIIYPETTHLLFKTEPTGLELILDDFTVTTPVKVLSWVNHKLRVEAPDQALQIWNSTIPLQWTSWSNGGDRKHKITVPQTSDDAIVIQADFALPPTPTPPPTPPPSKLPTAKPTIGKPQTSPTLRPATVPAPEPEDVPAPEPEDVPAPEPEDILFNAPTRTPGTTSGGEKSFPSFSLWASLAMLALLPAALLFN